MSVKQIFCTICASATVVFRCIAADLFVPKEGFVPNAETVIKIAEAVWSPIYGAESIAMKKPFVAVLTNGIWQVKGTLPKGWFGGVPYAEIAKTNGAILKVIHGK